MKKLYFIILLVILAAGKISATRLPDSCYGYQVKIVQVYPNPATSFINFEFSRELDKSYTLQVYNSIGGKMNESAVNSSKITISLDNYYRGLYIYQLRDKTGQIIDSGKFQVVK